MSYDTRFDLETIETTTIYHVIGIGAFFAIYAFFLQGITIGHLYTFGDLAPYYGARGFEKFTGTWHEHNLGYPYIYNVLPAYLGAITLLGGALAQNLFYLSLLPAGFLTFFVFVGRFVDPLPARYLAAGLYAINPITIGEFVNGSVAALLGFVGLPLLLHFLFETALNDDWLAALKAAIVFGATTASPWIVFWMVAPFAAYLGMRTWRTPRTFLKLVVTGVIGVCLALPSVHHVLQRAIGLETDAGGAVLANTLAWNYAEADALSVLRLAGNRGLAAMNELGYNSEPVLAIGLVIPAIALLAYDREDLHVFYAVVAGVTAFMVLTRAGITYPLFDALPALYSLRNPVRLQYSLLLSMSVLFGAGIATILSGQMPSLPGRQQRRRMHRVGGLGSSSGSKPNTFLVIIIVGLLTFSLFVYALPAVGALGQEEVRGEDYYVPESYDSVAEAVDGRILWVPYGYQSQLYLRHTYPDHVGIRSGGVLHGIPNTEYVESLFTNLADGESIYHQLDDLGVQYVVVDTDPPATYGNGPPRHVHRWGAPWVWGDPDAFAERFDASDRYTQVDEIDGFVIYRVEGVTSIDRLEARSGVHAIVTPEEPRVERLNGENLILNPRFDDGFAEWWVPPEIDGRQYQIIEREVGQVASLTVNDTAERLPIAQPVDVRKGHPYQLSGEIEGDGVIDLFWLDGDGEVVQRDSITAAGPSPPIVAPSEKVSVRIRPARSSTLEVAEVALYATTYPSAIGLEAAGEIPGIVTDGRVGAHPGATVVAINLDEETAAAFGADVTIVDAETVLPGELVFDAGFRQGVAVRPSTDDVPAAVPDGARAVTHDTPDGEVIDYWIAGSFNQEPVTVLHTSYHDDWEGADDGVHFRSNGWANAFTNTNPDEVRWTGDAYRTQILTAWASAWIVTLGAIGLVITRRRRSRLL